MTFVAFHSNDLLTLVAFQADDILTLVCSSVDVVSIACGAHHVAVVGSDGEVFTWGRGGAGRLGQGNEEDT